MQYDLNKKFFNRRLKILTKRLINTSGLVKTKITKIEKKKTSITRLVTIAFLNTKIKEIENKISVVTDLATKAVLNRKTAEVGNKISEFTNVVTKAALNTKASKIEYKGLDTMGFVVTPESNRLT